MQGVWQSLKNNFRVLDAVDLNSVGSPRFDLFIGDRAVLQLFYPQPLNAGDPFPITARCWSLTGCFESLGIYLQSFLLFPLNGPAPDRDPLKGFVNILVDCCKVGDDELILEIQYSDQNIVRFDFGLRVMSN